VNFAMQSDDRAPEPAAGDTAAGDTAATRRLFDGDSGCAVFSQRTLHFAAGASAPRSDPASDEVLYVLAGQGRADVGGSKHDLHAGAAFYVRTGTAWEVEEADELAILSVLIHEPEPGETPHAALDLAEREAGGATAGRQFRLLATPEVGCASVTQFVGYIPVGRAPDHFHTYDEVLYLLSGQGVLHIGDSHEPVAAGACIHLSPRLVHSLENSGPDPMQVLGVFRPAGSPSEAYYPDGARATY
jgi:quercetin dioxygenase-like cupin family protein